MAQAEVDHALLEYLRAEDQRIGNNIQELMRSRYQLLSVSVTSLALVLALGTQDRTSLHFAELALPYLVLYVALYGVSLLQEIMMLGGYKWYLEDRINALAGARVSQWESVIAPRLSHGRARKWHPITFLNYVAVVGSCALSTVVAFRHFQPWIAYADAFALTVLVFWGFAKSSGIKELREETRLVAERASEPPRPRPGLEQRLRDRVRYFAGRSREAFGEMHRLALEDGRVVLAEGRGEVWFLSIEEEPTSWWSGPLSGQAVAALLGYDAAVRTYPEAFDRWANGILSGVGKVPPQAAT